MLESNPLKPELLAGGLGAQLTGPGRLEVIIITIIIVIVVIVIVMMTIIIIVTMVVEGQLLFVIYNY